MAESFEANDIAEQDGYYYYLGIIRPGQIISLDMTGKGRIDNDTDVVKLTNQGWTKDLTTILGMFS